VSTWNKSTVQVSCILIQDRPMALLISQDEIEVWVPRSLLEHISKRNNGFLVELKVDMPEWLANEKGLNYDYVE